MKTFLSSVHDSDDLSNVDTLDKLKLLPWHLKCFWKSLVPAQNVFGKVLFRHVFSGTKYIAEICHNITSKLPEVLKYFYDPYWFPEKYVCITGVPSEFKQNWKLINLKSHCETKIQKTIHLRSLKPQNQVLL